MKSFIKFNKGIMAMPLPWQGWLMTLLAFNLVIPLFYFDRFEAQVTLAVMMAGMMIMTALTAATGFSRLLGLGHMLWVPLVVYLATRLDVHTTEFVEMLSDRQKEALGID